MAAAIESRHLRQAIEFAVLMAQEGQKFKPPMDYPAALRKYVKLARIPTSALPAVRRAIEGDERFRRRIAVGALPELVDPIGRLWLERPDGWEDEIVRLAADAEAAEAEADAARELKRADKRRAAAERVAVRARAEIAALVDRVADRDATVDELRADVTKLREALDEVRSELADARSEARHARDREVAALERSERAEAARAEAVEIAGAAADVRDDVLADRVALAAERSELARLAAEAESLASRLSALSSPPPSGVPVPQRRKALPMPGGVLGDSAAAAEYLLRSGASVLVDGYNVAKLAWPALDLAGQRVVLLDAVENLVRRFGSDVTVVFDGADVQGASADGRRIVRVVYSPAGVIADDVIRDEVGRLPPTRQVVVVTNDREVVRDVRAIGANTMSSDQLIGLMR